MSVRGAVRALMLHANSATYCSSGAVYCSRQSSAWLLESGRHYVLIGRAFIVPGTLQRVLGPDMSAGGVSEGHSRTGGLHVAGVRVLRGPSIVEASFCLGVVVAAFDEI